MEPLLMGLAAAGGQEFVKAMATEAWPSCRDAVARLCGRGDEQRTQRQAQQLEETRTAVRDGELAESSAVGKWQGRLEALLEEHPELAAELNALIEDLRQASASVSAGEGIAAGGDVHIEGSYGGVGAGVVHGAVTTGNPPQPGPQNG